MEKSHVGMGVHVCPVCGLEHDEVVLLQTRLGLPPKLTRNMFAGWQMCPEHQKFYDEGYIALVEVIGKPDGLATADRTGRVAHVRASAWSNIFNSPVPEHGLGFAEVDLFTILEQKMEDHHIMESAEYYGH
jgi:hypothetical protein